MSERILAERLARLRDSAPYKAYERARHHVLELKRLESDRRVGGFAPSVYWSEELRNFEYLLDASPLVIEKLRHHTYHITGLRVYDYRSNQKRAEQRFTDKLEALRALDDADVEIPEHGALGGFGFDIDRQLFNIDTLKFYEVLIALHKGAVLNEFRHPIERKLVWEIGAGWGGFPFQFKTICPNVTYVITDFPELFLFSATYLMAMFPDARVRFFGEVPAEETFADWATLDFIFVPDTFHFDVRPDNVDLMLNMVSFQEMTTRQVEGYVRRAYELKCPFFYSLNRDRSQHNHELSSVRTILSSHYWPHEIPMLPVGYPKMLDEDPDGPDRGYKHVLGWRRIRS